MLAKKKIHWNVWSNWVYIEQFLKHRYEYAISIFEKKKFEIIVMVYAYP